MKMKALAMFILLIGLCSAWWNSQWKDRYQLNLTETVGIERAGAFYDPVETRITFPFGKVSDCNRELRLIVENEGQDPYMLPLAVYNETYSGGYCVGANIAFETKTAASTTNTSHYLYFNNPSAPFPNYTTPFEYFQANLTYNASWVKSRWVDLRSGYYKRCPAYMMFSWGDWNFTDYDYADMSLQTGGYNYMWSCRIDQVPHCIGNYHSLIGVEASDPYGTIRCCNPSLPSWYGGTDFGPFPDDCGGDVPIINVTPVFAEMRFSRLLLSTYGGALSYNATIRIWSGSPAVDIYRYYYSSPVTGVKTVQEIQYIREWFVPYNNWFSYSVFNLKTDTYTNGTFTTPRIRTNLSIPYVYVWFNRKKYSPEWTNTGSRRQSVSWIFFANKSTGLSGYPGAEGEIINGSIMNDEGIDKTPWEKTGFFIIKRADSTPMYLSYSTHYRIFVDNAGNTSNATFVKINHTRFAYPLIVNAPPTPENYSENITIIPERQDVYVLRNYRNYTNISIYFPKIANVSLSWKNYTYTRLIANRTVWINYQGGDIINITIEVDDQEIYDRLFILNFTVLSRNLNNATANITSVLYGQYCSSNLDCKNPPQSFCMGTLNCTYNTQGTCVGNICQYSYTCSYKYPYCGVNCTTNSHCQSNQTYCDNYRNCSYSGICSNYTCLYQHICYVKAGYCGAECNNTADCLENLNECDGKRFCNYTAICSNDFQCLYSRTCYIVKGKCNVECLSDEDCIPGQYCYIFNYTCAGSPVSVCELCNDSSQCNTGYCSNGVCIRPLDYGTFNGTNAKNIGCKAKWGIRGECPEGYVCSYGCICRPESRAYFLFDLDVANVIMLDIAEFLKSIFQPGILLFVLILMLLGAIIFTSLVFRSLRRNI